MPLWPTGPMSPMYYLHLIAEMVFQRPGMRENLGLLQFSFMFRHRCSLSAINAISCRGSLEDAAMAGNPGKQI